MILRNDLAEAIEEFVTSQFEAAAKYENVEVLDKSGVYGLYRLCAKAYAAGYEDGERNGTRRAQMAENRRRDRAGL